MTTTAEAEPLQTEPQSTPELLDVFHFQTSTQSEWTPMTEERRTQLVEDLITWSKDETAMDWAYIDSLD